MTIKEPARQSIWSGIDLATMMSELASGVGTGVTRDQALQALCEQAVRMVPGADFASVTLNEQGSLSTPAYSHACCLPPDVAQYETGEGPCVEATWDEETVLIPCIAEETRWPLWLAQMRDMWQVQSMLAIHLQIPGPASGALNLYADDPHAFGDVDEAAALVFASHASLVISHAEREGQLKEAMDSRDVIGIAKGRLMERFGMPADAAFEVLRRISRDSNIKLRELAEQVANGTRELPLS